MSKELKKLDSIQAADGFDGYEDSVEGAAPRPSSEAFVVFTNAATYVVRTSGTVLPPDAEYIVGSIDRFELKWTDGKPERRQLEPGERFRDVAKLNDETPKAQWSEGPGGLQGPWENERVARLLNPDDMSRISFATTTTGGSIAVRDLVERTRWMRKYRGDEHLFPVVRLASVPWKTRYGMRQRPHFEVVRWVSFGGGTPEQEAFPVPPAPKPASESKALPAPAASDSRAFTPDDPITSGPQPATKSKPPAKGKVKAMVPQTVIPPTPSEELNDDLPW
jgi:hypothetical protein